MLDQLKQLAKRWVVAELGKVSVTWTRRSPDSWLAKQYPEPFTRPEEVGLTDTIERIAAATNKSGPQPLWSGYPAQARGATRLANQVRTTRVMGNLFAGLIRRRKPEVVVEFGTAFGVSGMYWLAGLEANGKGELLTFEPNEVWANIAKRNLSQISDRFTSVVGTFEDNVNTYLARGRTIDVAFIDAIHTREFVLPQLKLVESRLSPGGLIVLDDLNFSDEMQAVWNEVAADERFAASASFGSRVGILEAQRDFRTTAL